ncbi:MAG: type I restriction-modification system subunit M [Anaerolineae bacterium]|nr:type I restriction-modification system subunit M [Anaerolineae bacterium]
MPRTRNDQAKTTARQLASVIKSARDIMRKDKGLSSDVDRMPMLTWIMFLKFLDDMEQNREVAATLKDKPYRSIIEPPYRWRDWAADEGGITGDALLDFVNYDEATRPDGAKGPGLFAYLRNLQATPDDPRPDVVATIFREIFNRMRNGYLLRDVINKVNGINFAASEEMHTLSLLYETMLKEMRDAAGDAGEFYTPRPVVKLMVAATDPRLGEVVEDPACGTGGFLVETFEYLRKQAQTVQDRETLQRRSIRGGEAKALPYLLGQMNLLLHGLEAPQITYGNSLATPLRDIGPRQRVDVILTNPPFGGEEEAGIQDNFPKDKRTSETALLFLQLIMRKLRRTPKPGRAVVVVPNGTLFADGVAARIKEQLLTQFSLHTIVRLPNGVFAPYTSIPTNLLFFEMGGPTPEIWYYEQPLPTGRKNYTKTKPLRFSEFEPLLEWWEAREENEHAWKVNIKDVLKYDDQGKLLSANLDVKNPNGGDEIEHRPPAELVAEIVVKERQILALMQKIEAELGVRLQWGE